MSWKPELEELERRNELSRRMGGEDFTVRGGVSLGRSRARRRRESDPA